MACFSGSVRTLGAGAGISVPLPAFTETDPGCDNGLNLW
ncbi:hypothetical protein RGUI_2005 [Rhodovulum sp. P5]|nr:hypothetical protein RGUI_2005 [Rhodovulum sp. P5]